MANNLSLFKQYTTVLDQKVVETSLTSVLDGASDLARQGYNANELLIPIMEVQGMAKYDRAKGYVDGDVVLKHETKKCNYDRGRMFSVDSVDNIETAGIAYGQLAGVFITEKLVPELDAFRISTYANTVKTKKTSTNYKEEDFKDGGAVLKSLRTASTAMDNAEVAKEGRYLFITPDCNGMIEDVDLIKSQKVMNRFEKVIVVPAPRMYTEIELQDGVEHPEGGYKAAASAHAINYLIVNKNAVIQFQKHVAPKVITPEMNQNSDAWKFGYRNVGIAELYDNKLDGVYCSAATATVGA